MKNFVLEVVIGLKRCVVPLLLFVVILWLFYRWGIPVETIQLLLYKIFVLVIGVLIWYIIWQTVWSRIGIGRSVVNYIKNRTVDAALVLVGVLIFAGLTFGAILSVLSKTF